MSWGGGGEWDTGGAKGFKGGDKGYHGKKGKGGGGSGGNDFDKLSVLVPKHKMGRFNSHARWIFLPD